MTKYLIAWTEEDWYNITIEADSKAKALDMFHNREYDDHTVVHLGGELQDSIEIEEI